MSDKKARAKPIVFKKKLADKLLRQYPAVGKMMSKEDVLDLAKKGSSKTENFEGIKEIKEVKKFNLLRKKGKKIFKV